MKSILTLAVMSAFAFTAFADPTPAKTDKAATQCCGSASKTSCCKNVSAKDKKCCADKCACACCTK